MSRTSQQPAPAVVVKKSTPTVNDSSNNVEIRLADMEKKTEKLNEVTDNLNKNLLNLTKLLNTEAAQKNTKEHYRYADNRSRQGQGQGQRCYACGDFGHFARECSNRRDSQYHHNRSQGGRSIPSHNPNNISPGYDRDNTHLKISPATPAHQAHMQPPPPLNAYTAGSKPGGLFPKSNSHSGISTPTSN